MKQVVNFPCPKCKCLCNAEILSQNPFFPFSLIVTLRTKCCGSAMVKLMNQEDQKFYIKEVLNGEVQS